MDSVIYIYIYIYIDEIIKMDRNHGHLPRYSVPSMMLDVANLMMVGPSYSAPDKVRTCNVI